MKMERIMTTVVGTLMRIITLGDEDTFFFPFACWRSYAKNEIGAALWSWMASWALSHMICRILGCVWQHSAPQESSELYQMLPLPAALPPNHSESIPVFWPTTLELKIPIPSDSPSIPSLSKLSTMSYSRRQRRAAAPLRGPSPALAQQAAQQQPPPVPGVQAASSGLA